MLRREDEDAINDLFERLRRVEGQSGPRDADAEALIHQRLSENPAAAYYLAQTVVVQEAALREQQARIAELERSGDRGRSGFLGGIFGDDRPESREPQAQRRGGPWGQPQGGGFLAGAAQTALGVTGGLLLGSAIAGIFGSTPAMAAEDTPPADEPAADDGGMDGGGDDWGGGFDIGGDF
ncbi:hypothetical protein SAMN06295905_1161 [Devosia lucknowensis]|uniref:DUF2076 domain-containing protein n=1 Tax=Devosia lucknowensis TaxID=1096929 RepID=A0A1Y6ER52_9HYPH|nr:DUF2076 family protein [Devosia lucknowensis]SMQ65185.1 hypothetical protein SAMN06295905_1161 [Devosia lucknowensis]